MKQCSKCRLEKELSEFHRNIASKDGRTTRCKACANEDARLWRKQNNERNRAIQTKWREHNREHACRASREWQKANPEKTREYARNRYWLKKSSGEEVLRDVVFERDEWMCRLCGDEIPRDLDSSQCLTHPLYPNIDHIIPLSKGGIHSYDNVQAVHRKCNAAKALKILEDAVS